MPAPRGDDEEDDEDNDSPAASDDTIAAEVRVVNELGGSRQSVARMTGSKRSTGSTEQNTQKKKNDKKRKRVSASERSERRAKKNKEVEDDSEEEMLNSEAFTPDKRPEMFKDDKLFNRLSFEKAAQICWDEEQLQRKKELKNKAKNGAEKADDKLPLVKVSEGQDNAMDKIHKAARQL